MQKYKPIIKYHKRDKIYIVTFKELTGCITYGKTIKEARANAKEALAGYLESVRSRGII